MPLGNLTLASDVRLVAGLALSMDKADEACRLARLGTRVMAATFELRRAESVTIESLWPERTALVLKGPSARWDATPADWVNAMSLAVALDDAESQRALLAHQDFASPEGVRWDGFWEPWVDLWVHALAGRTAEAGHSLAMSLELTDPKQVSVLESCVLSVYVPPLEVMYRALEGDAAGFDTAIEKALTRHNAHWGAQPEELEALVPGLLLGAVRWGDRLGVRRTVDSPLFRLLPTV
ncbi:MAG: immunity 49 family protein [Sorangiineae bacterium]|nr:immunity 49 family protein [Sorangiineae bacterium]